MTTQPANEGNSSQIWAATDADWTAATNAAKLDVSSEWPDDRRRRTMDLALLDIKPGDRVLEVGPGTGAFAQQMAALVGETGSVVGVDLNAGMAAIAAERWANSGLPLTFQQGDVNHLEFPDGAFDACFATLVFLHLDDPLRALREMVRVTRPGGRVVISESDHETRIFDAPDIEASRAVTEARMQVPRNPRIGRMLPRLFKEAGLTDVVVEPTVVNAPDREAMWARAPWASAVQRAVREGKLVQERADAWVNSLDQASRAGHFFAPSIFFSVAGRKPRGDRA